MYFFAANGCGEMKISVAFIRKGIDWDTTTTTGNNYITKKKVYLLYYYYQKVFVLCIQIVYRMDKI